VAEGVALMLLTVAIWGGWVVVSRMGVTGSMNAYDIVAVRFMVAGLLLLPVLLKKGMKVGPYGYGGALVLMMCMGAPYNVMTISAFRFAPASHSAIVYASTTGMTCLMSYWFLKESMTAKKIAGLVISVGGILLLMVVRPSVTVPHMWIGHVLLFVAGCMWGGYAVFAKAWRVDPVQGTAVVAVSSMLVYLPIYFLFLPHQLGTAALGDIAFQGFYQGVLTNVLALWAYNKGVELLGASGAAIFIPLVPVMAALEAIPFLKEVPGHMELAGILLAGMGVLLASGALSGTRKRITLRLRQRRKAPKH
jgi:drug/metabolite transporter (DMT)-like permease